MRAVVVMPDDAPAVKIDGVRADGAEIDFVGAVRGGARRRGPTSSPRATAWCSSPRYDDRRIIAGQGTAGLEIVEQLAELGYGRGAVHGAGAGRRWRAHLAVSPRRSSRCARTRGSFGVEPELAADARESLHAGHIVRWGPELVGRTAADGMRTNALGRLTFPQMAAYVDDIADRLGDGDRGAPWRAPRGWLGWCWSRPAPRPSPRGSSTPTSCRRTGRWWCCCSGGNVDAGAYAAFVGRGTGRRRLSPDGGPGADELASRQSPSSRQASALRRFATDFARGAPLGPRNRSTDAGRGSWIGPWDRNSTNSLRLANKRHRNEHRRVDSVISRRSHALRADLRRLGHRPVSRTGCASRGRGRIIRR